MLSKEVDSFKMYNWNYIINFAFKTMQLSDLFVSILMICLKICLTYHVPQLNNLLLNKKYMYLIKTRQLLVYKSISFGLKALF